jgi:cytidylate kinase
MSIVVISLVCNIMLAKYGAMSKYGADIPIAVIGIAMKVFTIVINIVVGVILGAQPILGFNYGAKNFARVKETFKIVLTTTFIIGIIATLIFELCPQVVIRLFGTESDLYMEFATKTFRIFLMLVTFTCIIKMSSIFFQAVGQPIKAGIVSLLRDIVCFVPLVIILPNFLGVEGTLYAAPIADLVGIICTSILVLLFFKNLGKENAETKKVSTALKKSHKGVIVTIARQHGSQGKYIGELVAKQLNIPYYYKEMTAIAAKESGLDKEFISDLHLNSPTALNDLYLSTSPVQYAIQAQDRVIQEIANQGSCVIVGRAADYVLRDNKDLVRVFIYAPKDYRVSNIMEMYKDTKQEAIKNVEKSDRTRSNYYKTISGLEWGKIENYDLCIDSSVGKEECARIICEYVNSRSNKNRK